MRKRYPSDVTDAQWALIEPLLPPRKSTGRPRTVDLREVVNALFYQARTGCQWDSLPHDLPAKSTVWDYFTAWNADGTLQKLVDVLRGKARVEAGREETPSAACIDTQTVKTSEIGGPSSYDGGKKIKGRKRHIVTDTLGFLLAVVVLPARLDDGTYAPYVLRQLSAEAYPRLSVVFGDSKYNNRTLDAWMEQTGASYRIEVKKRPEDAQGFVPVPKRWVVERTHANLGRCRRLNKDHEYNLDSSEAWVRIAAARCIVRRMRPNTDQPQAPFRYPKRAKVSA